MAKPKKQVESGRKEAPLVLAGYTESAAQPRIIQPEDKEYKSYRDLLQGFFEKLINWNDIFQDEQYKRNSIFSVDLDKRDFQVLQTPTGLVIRPPNPDAIHSPYKEIEPERVLIMSRFISLNDPGLHLFNTEFLIRPGQADKHILIDPEGRPLERVEIEVDDQRHAHSKSLTIKAKYPDDRGRGLPGRTEGVHYELGRGQLEITEGICQKLMSEAYQTHLFNTIDALIPGVTGPIGQPKRKADQQTRLPKALPPARRRKPGQ